jgi:hypothetical protein
LKYETGCFDDDNKDDLNLKNDLVVFIVETYRFNTIKNLEKVRELDFSISFKQVIIIL